MQALTALFCSCVLLLGAARAAPNARVVAEGTSVTTSKGFSFTLVFRSRDGREAWRDDTTHVVWGDKLSKRARRKEAEKLCAKNPEGENMGKGLRLGELPSLNDFVQAEAHGFREVLPNITDAYYWVKSSVPGAANIGHVFSGNLGRPILILYRSINFENVRCIRREESRLRDKNTPKKVGGL